MAKKKQFKSLRERKTWWERAGRDRARLLKIKALRAKGRKTIDEPINRLLGGLHE